MARLGLGRWLLSWATKPLVRIGTPFKSIWNMISKVAPRVTQSQVAESYRAAEKTLGLEPTLATMDRTAPWEPSLMTEEKFGAARRYRVTFDVQVKYPLEGKVVLEKREVYFMEHMSASGYESAYLAQYMGEGEKETGIITGARAISVAHFAGLPY